MNLKLTLAASLAALLISFAGAANAATAPTLAAPATIGTTDLSAKTLLVAEYDEDYDDEDYDDEDYCDYDWDCDDDEDDDYEDDFEFEVEIEL